MVEENTTSMEYINRKDSGKLTIFFGYAAGVGKTYAMLQAAQEQFELGVNIVIGYIEPHDRPETTKMMEGLPQIPVKRLAYKNITLAEFDIDAAIELHPEIIVIDELAHTNVSGSRNQKRYQDVEELLKQGIDVYTTVNVQHIESLNDIIKNTTQIAVKETVPDYIFNNADTIKLIDINIDELIFRLYNGKIYHQAKIEQAVNNFFKTENLQALREITVHKIAEHISHEKNAAQNRKEKKANMNIMTCIGTGPSTAKCLRWTARTARAFNVPWVAVVVKQQDTFLAQEDNDRIEKNLKLAKELGAEIVILEGSNLAETIAEYAKLTGITSIVIGKSNRSSYFKFVASLEDKLIEMVPNVEIHVISEARGAIKKFTANTGKKHWYNDIKFSWLSVIKTIICLFFATVCSIILESFGADYTNFIIFYIVAILVVSRITEGYIYGIMASIVSVLIFDFYFVFPYDSFYIANVRNLMTFFLMLAVALITSGLVGKMKQQTNSIMQRQHRIEILYTMNQKLSLARNYPTIAEMVTHYFYDVFQRDIIFYLKNKKDVPMVFQSNGTIKTDLSVRHELPILQWVFLNGKQAGNGTNTFSGTKYLYVPLLSQQQTIAVLGIDCTKEKLDSENFFFLQMLLTQVTLTLEKRQLALEQQEVMLQSRVEEMKNNILRSISHDLRSPLTGISGLVSSLLENEKNLDEDRKKQVLISIQAETQWIIRLVENILSATRINDETLKVIKVDEALEEIIASAITNIKRRFPEQVFSVRMPDEFLLVPMDGILIVQVLMNLFENAIRYSATNQSIVVNVYDKMQEVEVEVVDEGSGFDAQTLEQIFEQEDIKTFSSGDTQRGLGLGLSICKSIIEAHGGIIRIKNNPKKGAKVSFTLPKESDE